jgi:shikimate dehydrogenase
MNRFAVIGHPVSHSLSPLMHNTAFQLLGIDSQYEKLDIVPSDLKNEIAKFRNSEWGGFNITTPLKEAIIPFLDKISDEANSIHSVNTVRNKDGKLFGTNTDILGIWHSLEPYQIRIKDQECVVLGSGGVAGSVLYVIAKYLRPKRIRIIARTEEKAIALQLRFGHKDIPIDVCSFSSSNLSTVIQESVLIVNCTTVGMYPNLQETPLPGIRFHNNQIIYDLIYRPMKTYLLQDANSQGATILDGLDMFIQQGAAAFHLWTGKDMPLPQIRQALEKALTS